ncbi:pseudouridine synthase [Candidatus Laterigemmans baculatus]|uniref:pseudouridine synthase n=1 Tax=Candidatus Laterigemmans baculatus TaxID=2770505 RepID=UPI0013DB9D44|nr:pseudouridine synthase [Candidatus Laterigemmans baculatus]
MPRKSAPKRPPTTGKKATPKRPAGRKPSPPTAAGKKRTGGGEGEGNLQRLQRVLASAGYGSRRQCEELIVEGRVEVDGQAVTELGTQVDPKTSKIYVDGTLLKREKLAYFVVNKPPGVVTTNSDPQGRTRVIDLVQERQRLFPVGRLDRSSEGLILLTNDGELAQQLAHPRYGVRKTYRVTVAGKVDSEKLAQMKRGIYIAEGRVGVEGAKILRHRGQSTELEILLREGKNREIRRILARLGHKVLTLQRIALGPLRLGELPRGAYRPVSSDELRRLRDEVRIQSKQAAAGSTEADDEAAPKASKAKPSKPKAGTPPRGGASRPPKSQRPKPLEGSKTIGTVIGGEQDLGGDRETKSRRAPQAGKAQRPTSKRPTSKRPTQKGPIQKGPKKDLGKGPKKDRGERR